jgi:uncharacterized protein
MHVSEIWIYPVKSLSGVRLSKADVRFAGLKYDREWMVVDADGIFVTQRQIPEMALIKVAMIHEGVLLSGDHGGVGAVLVPFEIEGTEVVQVRVWGDLLWVRTVNREVDAWLSRVLGRALRLVRMDDTISIRKTSIGAGREASVRFADDYPYHLACQSSLDELNSRLGERVGMERFRPNIVVSDTVAYEEDEWRCIRIGKLTYQLTSKCERCGVVNVNPVSGLKERQPLKTLATFRRDGFQVYFGQNVVALGEGVIGEGDHLVVLEQ